jgi:transposase
MAPYSRDLGKRVIRAWDAGMDAESVAVKYEVSRAWVHRLVQRWRETGSIAPPEANAISPAGIGRSRDAAGGPDRGAA